MQLFFNELSLKQASDDNEAKEWIEKLIKLSILIQKIIQPFENLNQLKIRTRDEFQTFEIIEGQFIQDVVFRSYRPQDKEFGFFFQLFGSPHIEEGDPKKEDYDYHSIKLENIESENDMSGLGATYIKNSMAVSFDNDEIWDKCQIAFEITFLNNKGEFKENTQVKHASKTEHIIQCHLGYFANLYDWGNYSPYFNADSQEQNILPLLEIYSLYLENEENIWSQFYKEIHSISETERVAKVRRIAQLIAEIQGWEEATGSIRSQNANRTLYTIPSSNFIISVDTQHGDFEVLKNQKSPNHYGSVSFDGKRFKPAEDDHSINI